MARVRGREWRNKVSVTCSPDKLTKTETCENLPVLNKKGDEEKLDTDSVNSEDYFLNKKGDEEKLDTDSVNSEESFHSFSQSHSYNSLSYLLLQLNICSGDIRIH